jgi:flagellar motility protein MotE (MotC chaperone)
VQSYLKTYDQKHIENMQSLVKMYESMKPKDAARIFEQLQMDVLLEVATNMKERQMAAIMAEMSPDAAKALTMEMATTKPIPLASN